MSVLPRILDPSMKFTVDSIKQMPSKEIKNNNKINNNENIEDDEDNDEDDIKSTIPAINQSVFYTFYNNYKYVILIIIIIILLIILGIVIYKYYNKKKKETVIANDGTKPKIDDSVKEKIDTYISNYIIDDEENNNNGDNENNNIEEEYKENDEVEENDTEKSESVSIDYNLEDITNELAESSNFNNSNNLNNNLQSFGIIVQEHVAINPNISVDSTLNQSRFEEIDNLETESISEILYNEINEDNRSDNEINEDNRSEIESDVGSNDDQKSVDLNDIINELNNQSTEKESKIKKRNDKKKVKKDDNIDHFKSFINKN